jgi:(p)ppGpp synthase/HD superfamily hydrolase
MSTLERAIVIAAEGHAGVRDKAGAPYVLHPLRVMMRVDSDEERIVAVLHDVVEDAGWTLERLAAEGFSPSVLEALASVTKRPEDEDPEGDDPASKLRRYLNFVARAAANPVGRKVKIADLQDNMDLSRIASPTAKDLARTEKYRRALEFLQSFPADRGA